MAITIRGQRLALPTLAFPDATNTGWAATGTTLTTYAGATSFSSTVTISDKTINSDLSINSGGNLTLTRCQINGKIDCDGTDRSVTLTDCNVNAGATTAAAVGFANLTITRCNIEGGNSSVNAYGRTVVVDSYLHNQYLGPTSTAHINGFLSNGGGGFQITHCTVECKVPDNASGGGPTGCLNLFGDFGVIHDVTADRCYFPWTTGGYSVALGYNTPKPFGSNPTGVVVSNCTFEKRPSETKGGVFGTTTGYKDTEPTNHFTNNLFTDGTPVPSAG